MSTQAPIEKMSGQEAQGVLVQHVFAPIFLEKLAAHGIRPQTQDEAVRYIRLGQKLLAADNEEQVKAAATKVDFLKQAEADLDRELQRRYGYTPEPTENLESQYVEKYAEQLGDHPLIQQAVADYNEAIDAEEARLAAATS